MAGGIVLIRHSTEITKAGCYTREIYCPDTDRDSGRSMSLMNNMG